LQSHYTLRTSCASLYAHGHPPDPHSFPTRRSSDLIGVIASEFILAPAGLGRVISDAYTDFNNRQMYALMLLLVIVATVVNMLLQDRKSTRLNSSHVSISYAVFCLKKKTLMIYLDHY